MEEYVVVGILVNTHALKGEVRIISDFEFKEKVFVVGNHLYIGDAKTNLVINSYRPHKQYDMVTFVGLDKIEEVTIYKGKKVYFKKSDLNLNENEILDSDIIGMDVYFNNNLIGKIDDIELNGGNKLFVVNEKLIPYNNNFIETINVNQNRIILKNIEGLI